MKPTFRDHFSSAAPDYARFRPGYPPELFAWIASESPSLEWAWDAATGSGQAARGLADHFARVVATDASRAQLASAAAHPRVHYVRSQAEASGLASSIAGAVVAAQAVHWFDRPAFFGEAARVGRPGALVAVWTYWTLRIDEGIDRALDRFYADVVGPYWPPERRLVERQYVDIEMPFEPVTAPPLSMALPMTVESLAGFIGTWSATQRYREATGTDPVPDFIASIARLWGDARERLAEWPIAIRAGRAGRAGRVV